MANMNRRTSGNTNTRRNTSSKTSVTPFELLVQEAKDNADEYKSTGVSVPETLWLNVTVNPTDGSEPFDLPLGIPVHQLVSRLPTGRSATNDEWNRKVTLQRQLLTALAAKAASLDAGSSATLNVDVHLTLHKIGEQITNDDADNSSNPFADL